MPDRLETAARFLSVVARLELAESESDALDLLIQARDLLCVEHAVFASLIRDDATSESIRFLVAADAAWCLAYERGWWYSHDAWLLYAAGNTQPAADSRIHVRTDHQRAAIKLARRFGVNSAYIVPAPAAAGVSRVGVLMLGSAQDGYFDQANRMDFLKPLSRCLAMELHEWWIHKICTDMLATHRLGQLDLELLRLERAGESTKTIARRCDLTPASVDSRFQRLNAKLGVPNRKAAARLAAEYGLIP